MMVVVDAASVRRTNAKHITRERGMRGLETQIGNLTERRMLWHLSLVPEGRDNGAQRGLLDHRAAQRCPRMPQCWARAHELHLRHGHKFSAPEDGRSVKIQRAFDAYAPTF